MISMELKETYVVPSPENKKIYADLCDVSVPIRGMGDDSRLITNVDLFSATDTYKAFRKGEISDEGIYFMFTNFAFSGEEVSSLVVGKIRNLTIEKAIRLGVIDNLLIFGEDGDRHTYALQYFLTAAIKVSDYDKELDYLLTVFEDRLKNQMSGRRDKQILTHFLKTFWYGLKSDWGTNPFSERAVNNKENIKILKKHYQRIYDYFNEEYLYVPKDPIRSFTLDLEPRVSRPSNYNTIFSYNYAPELSFGSTAPTKEIHPINKDEVKNILSGVYRCPYVDFEFLLEKMNLDKKFNAEDKIYVMLTALSMDSLDPTLDFDKKLRKIEMLSGLWGTDSKMSDILHIIFSQGRYGQLSSFTQKILGLKDLSKSRQSDIYNLYFKNLNVESIYDGYRHKLRIMIEFKLSDDKMAEFIQECFDNGDGVLDIKEEFACSPLRRHTYPGFKSLMLIIRQEIAIHSRYPESPDKRSSDELLLERYFFNQTIRFSDNSLITWKMANNPKFMRKIINSDNMMNNNRINLIIAKMNLANLGFNTYMNMLEDKNRKQGQTKFDRTSKNALRFATKSEIFMYKNKMDAVMLASAASTDYKVLQHLIKISNFKSMRDVGRQIQAQISNGLTKNKVLSAEEMISIMVELGSKDTGIVGRVFNTNRINERPHTKNIQLNVVSNKALTVKDFSDYYDKIGGAAQ